MLVRDGDKLGAVYTGYPYPDTEKPQIEMLARLFSGYQCIGEMDYHDMVGKLNGIFFGKVDGMLEIRSVVDSMVSCSSSGSGGICVYHDGNVGVYVVDVDRVSTAIRRFNYINLEEDEDDWLLVVPVFMEADFSGVVNVPLGNEGVLMHPNVFEGLKQPFLIRGEIYCGLTDIHDTDVPFFKFCLPRLICGVIPRLSTPSWVSDVIDRDVMRATSSWLSFGWLSDLYELPMEQIFHGYDSIEQDVMRLAVDYYMRQLLRQVTDAVKWDVWEDGRVKFEMPGIGEAWKWNEDVNKSGGIGVNNMYAPGIEVVSGDRVDLVLANLLGSVVSPFFLGNGNVFGSRVKTMVNCMPCLCMVLGCDQRELAKKVMLDGLVGKSGRGFDLGSVESGYRLVDGYSLIVIPMLAASGAYAMGRLHVMALNWLPLGVIQSQYVDRERFIREFRKELLVVAARDILFAYLLHGRLNAVMVDGFLDALRSDKVRLSPSDDVGDAIVVSW